MKKNDIIVLTHCMLYLAPTIQANQVGGTIAAVLVICAVIAWQRPKK